MAPCSAVPEPAGRPRPSGMTEMSMAASSAALGVRPRLGLGVAANAAVAARAAAAASMSSGRIDMAHLARGVDAPAGHGVVVVGLPRRVVGEPGLARGLHGA